jgi:Cation transporter/ATPase, N-terminus
VTVAVPSRRGNSGQPVPLTAITAATLPVRDVLDRLGSGLEGLPEDEAKRRLQSEGPNTIRSYRVRAAGACAPVAFPLLVLLAVTALASAFVARPATP